MSYEQACYLVKAGIIKTNASSANFFQGVNYFPCSQLHIQTIFSMRFFFPVRELDRSIDLGILALILFVVDLTSSRCADSFQSSSSRRTRLFASICFFVFFFELQIFAMRRQKAALSSSL
jgi:hypothetical protein